MKRAIRILFLLILIVAIVSGFFAYKKFSKPATRFDAEERYIYNKEQGSAETEMKEQIIKNKLLMEEDLFFKVADILNVWKKVTPGRFAIKKGASLWDVLQMLRKNKQSNTVTFTIKKLQTKEGLSGIIGKRFNTDSADAYRFLINADSLQPLGVDTNTVFTLITPGTYQLHYKSTPAEILKMFSEKTDSMWKANDWDEKATASGLSREQAYILASIVEEETDKDDEKGMIASVYRNRMRTGMKLGADPTVKFALRNFDLRRILHDDLKVVSPYNTYQNAGLPPGPICTPSVATLSAMLPVPESKNLFFVAKDDFSGYHIFTTNYADHLFYAKKYQEALSQRNIMR